jgi:hypothetical protein
MLDHETDAASIEQVANVLHRVAVNDDEVGNRIRL